MPGIVGIIGPEPEDECQRLVHAMLRTMQHEPTYVSGTHFAPSVGAYGGWISHRNSFAARQSSVRGDGGEVLLFAGECFPSIGRHRKNTTTTALAKQICLAIHTHGPSFIADLNGLFSGFLIDTRRQRCWSSTIGMAASGSIMPKGRNDVHRQRSKSAPSSTSRTARARRRRRRAVSPLWKHAERAHAVPRHPRTSRRNAAEHRARHREEQRRYFVPESWEAQPPLDEAEFESQFREAFLRALPGYFSSDVPIGISITGGLDTRMILACMPASPELRSLHVWRADTQDARCANRRSGCTGQGA